ncbi:MAG: DUF4238 domain-containing protein [Candidatus Dormibacteria bacterium]
MRLAKPVPMMLHKQPASFQLLAQLLRKAPDQAALLILGYDLDLFDAEIPDFAVQTGITEAELRQLAEDARKGQDSGQPKVPEQHLVSKVLLRQFCARSSIGLRMGRYSLKWGKAAPVSPETVAKVINFVKIDSRSTEEVWGKTESKLPSALEAAVNGSLFGDSNKVQVIKDTIALHYARSYAVVESHNDIWRNGLDAHRQFLLSHPELLDALSSMKTGGSASPPSPESRAQVLDEVTERARGLYERGTAFRFRVVGLFESARQLLSGAGLQILLPATGSELLIGDSPVITSDATGHRRGIAEGVPIGTARHVFMPLGPHLGVALAASDQDIEVSAAEVQRLNRWEIEAARCDVFMRPGSGLAALAEKVRPPTRQVS